MMTGLTQSWWESRLAADSRGLRHGFAAVGTNAAALNSYGSRGVESGQTAFCPRLNEASWQD